MEEAEITTDTAVSVSLDNLDSEIDTQGTNISIALDSLNTKIDTQNDLLIFLDILVVAILVFFAFKNSLRGLWK